MNDSRPTFVLDTNVLIDHVDIIPSNDKAKPPDQLTVDLSGAHLVIPTTVIRELSSFKGESSERGRAARVLLKRLRDLMEGEVPTMSKAYNLMSPIRVPGRDQILSVLPIHKAFADSLPFSPSENDMDGQIILTALSVKKILSGAVIDTSMTCANAVKKTVYEANPDNVILLTNDNGLAIRANRRGIKTSRYGCRYSEPYKGRRDLLVPPELFNEFYSEGELDYDVWQLYMPEEPPLVANEFIAMSLRGDQDYPEDFFSSGNPYYRHIGRYDATTQKIVKLEYVSEAPFEILNDGQAMYAEALLCPDISAVICTGPAGSGKTYLPAAYGVNACQKGKFLNVAVVPCANIGRLGALPGSLNKKMSLDVGPTRNAIQNYLLRNDPSFKKEWEKVQKSGTEMGYLAFANGDPKTSLCNKLDDYINFIWQAFFRNIPVESARGLDFARMLIIYDEFQDQSAGAADMLIKRLGQDGKMVITGDIRQIHAPYLDENNNGIVYVLRELHDDPMVARVSLLEVEVARHKLVRMIAERQASKRKILP